MRAVRFTKAESENIRSILSDWLDGTLLDARVKRSVESAIQKLGDAEAPQAAGVAAGPIETALVKTARGRVVPLASGPAGYSRLSQAATKAGATVEQAEAVGAWLGRQGWFRGTTTALGVMAKWHEWLPRALAEQAPTTAREGFDGSGDAGQGAAGPSGGGGVRGKAPGFR